MNGSEKSLKERKKYVNAYNATQIKIWTQKIADYDVMETGGLLQSLSYEPLDTNPDYSELEIRESFKFYGFYVNDGVGKNTRRGNPGDIGRDNPRIKKKWYSPKHFLSVMNLREFYARNLGEEAATVISNALTRDVRRAMLSRAGT